MANKFIRKIANATLASGESSTILAATAGTCYKLWQAIVTPGANADVVTFKNGSTAQSLAGVTTSLYICGVAIFRGAVGIH